MDAFELLKKDHKKVSQLFKEIEAASGQAKKQIFARLKSELDVHASVEERIFYPALENKEEARDITLEAYEEHKVVKDLLSELATGSAPEDEWDAKLTVLKENVEHHVEEEEGELFSKARKVLSSDEIGELGAEMEAEKASQQGVTPSLKQGARAGNEVGNRNNRASTKKSNSEKDPNAAKGKERPGVLKRLAKLVGLGGEASTSKRSAKRSSTKTTKARSGKKAGKKTAAKGGDGTRSSKSSKTGKRRPGKSTKASRLSTTAGKSAARGGAKKVQGRTAKKRSRSR